MKGSIQKVAWTVVVTLTLVVGLASFSFPQVGSSGINGVVTDPSGSVVPKATVRATSTSTGFSRAAVGSEAGTYSITDLPPGLYDVSTEASGFKKSELKGLRLFVGQITTANIQLVVGEVTESVSVTSETPLLQETSGQVGTVIEGKLLTDLPLNGRNFLQLNLLAPGVIRHKNGGPTNDTQLDPSSSVFNVNGQRAYSNLYLLDGLVMKEYSVGMNTFAPNVDAIQEFQAATSNYSAVFGSEAAGQINLVTKSGSNQLHGVVYEFLRNDVFDARDFFAQTKGAPPYKRNQFGGTLGGPIYLPKLYEGENKTFFFVALEFLRDVKNIPLTGNFPTPAQINGDLSTLLTPGKPLIDPFTGSPFPNGIIPENRMPSTLLPFLKTGVGTGPWIPAPNSNLPGFNYFNDSRRVINTDQVISRIDHKFNDTTFFYGRYAYSSTDRRNANLNPNVYTTDFSPAHSVGGHLTKVFSPTTLFDISIGYNRFLGGQVKSTAFENDVTNKILKIQGLATIPESWGVPVWGVTGFSGLGGPSFGPRAFLTEMYEWHPALTLNRGTHNMRLGMQIKRRLESFDEIITPNGSNSFDGRFSGYPLGDFLLGVPSVAGGNPDPFFPEFRYTELGPYFQDDWKVTSNLTLNLGLRYEWQSVPLAKDRNVANLYFPSNGSSPQLVIADSAGEWIYHGIKQSLYPIAPFVRASSVGLPEALVSSDKTNIAPRFGFAYRIPGLKDSVVRGGYGIFYSGDVNEKWVEGSINLPFVRGLSKPLDQSNFREFDWFNPLANITAAGLQTWANGTEYTSALMQAWNLSLERSMWGTVFSASYVGNKVQHLPSFFSPNQARPGPGSFVSRRRWPDWGNIAMATYLGNSNYHSGQFKVQRPMSKGLGLILSYTWSKSIDDSSGTWMGDGDRGPTYVDSYNMRLHKALSALDIRHRVAISYVYELPVGKGKPLLNRGGVGNAVLGGWQINGVTTFQTGSPFSVTQAFNGANIDVGQNRPDLIGDPNALSKSRPRGEQVAQFFDTSAFKENRPADLVNGPYRIGTAGRNIVIGPGTANFDFAVYKDFNFAEARKFQFRAEFFNIFNRPNFRQPGASLGTPQFGRISSTFTDARDIQFGFKLYF